MPLLSLRTTRKDPRTDPSAEATPVVGKTLDDDGDEDPSSSTTSNNSNKNLFRCLSVVDVPCSPRRRAKVRRRWNSRKNGTHASFPDDDAVADSKAKHGPQHSSADASATQELSLSAWKGSRFFYIRNSSKNKSKNTNANKIDPNLSVKSTPTLTTTTSQQTSSIITTTDQGHLHSSMRSESKEEKLAQFSAPYQLIKHAYFAELGYMQFTCANMDQAQQDALAKKHPILAIEVRIPGDADAGRDIFRHPLIVEAARTLFTPVVRIVSAEDDAHQITKAKLIERAPSGKLCRTKVVFLNPHSGTFLTDALFGDGLTRVAVVQAMCHALATYSNTSVPQYLALVCEEEVGRVDVMRHPHAPARKRDCTAYFGVEDAAKSEVQFAALDGVLGTKPGFWQGRRVVQVTYDARKVCFSSLVRHALHADLLDNQGIVFYKTNDQKRSAQVELARIATEATIELKEFEDGQVKADYDPKHALRKTPLRFVPLTDIQSTRANRLVHLGRFNEAMHLLSPQQGVILMQAMRTNGGSNKLFHEVTDRPILPAWLSVMEHRHCPSKVGEGDEDVAPPPSLDRASSEPLNIYQYETTNVRRRYGSMMKRRFSTRLSIEEVKSDDDLDSQDLFVDGDSPSNEFSVLTM